MPNGGVDKVTVQDNKDGTVSVKYDPKVEGVHELNVKYNGEHVQGKLTMLLGLCSYTVIRAI